MELLYLPVQCHGQLCIMLEYWKFLIFQLPEQCHGHLHAILIYWKIVNIPTNSIVSQVTSWSRLESFSVSFLHTTIVVILNLIHRRMKFYYKQCLTTKKWLSLGKWLLQPSLLACQASGKWCFWKVASEKKHLQESRLHA